ncbi:MAG: hypothetical protein JXJ20_06200 [Anaerolineae bacterium]|nr:hypothetical protein [Anaerolineae bacterium]
MSSLAPALFRLGLVLLGIIIGLAWAYQGAPVKFYDAEPVHLADGYKDQWIKMTAAEFERDQDSEEAKRKIIEAGVSPEMIQDLIDKNRTTEPELTRQLQALLSVAEPNKSEAAKKAEKIEHSTLGSITGPLICLLGTTVLGIVLALFMTFYWAIPVGKWAKGKSAPAAITGAPGSLTGGATTHAERVAAQRVIAGQRTDFAAEGEMPPVGQYMSSYMLGDDLYDDSFSIESASDEFLGECGSGISETIGVGDPKKVTATEVWLFDKTDIRTVTKVLMSEHAYNDQALRTKLAPKGEAVLAEPGMITTLETQQLRVRVRVVDLQYGQGALPTNSFFERLSVELAAWPKEGAEGDLGGPSLNSSTAFGDTSELLNY